MRATRRDVFGMALAGGALAASSQAALAQPSSPRLIDAVQAACRRLAPLGWRDLMLRATSRELDLDAGDLPAELAKPLSRIDRGVPGFAELATTAVRGVEAGNAAGSLLFHAFASPDVVEDGAGRRLRGFPTAAEIEAVENYVYGVRPPSLQDLRHAAGDRELRVVVFAPQYRAARGTVHGRHADHVYSRVGISRMGTVEAAWDGAARDFAPLDPARPFDFRPLPQRFAAYIACRTRPGQHGFPAALDPAEGDAERDFWLPLHKLFSGPECLAGLTLDVDYQAHFRNEKLRRFHRYLQLQGYGSEWGGEHLNRFPFVIEDAEIAALAEGADTAPGTVTPRPRPFVNRAEYQGRPLTFQVPGDWTSTPGVMFFSSGQILGGEADTPEARMEGGYLEGALPDYDRSAPEYISVRHVVREDGTVENLNLDPRMNERIREGDYRAQHYIDFSGDGWVGVTVGGLEALGTPLAAYATVSPPDFYPTVSQRDLRVWWRDEVPAPIRAALWAMPPYTLSERRMAPNIEQAVGFSVYDVTACAVVGAPHDAGAGARVTSGATRYSGLPDHSPGVFDPGWDASFSLYYNNPEERLVQYLQNYGLGTPFVEDVKLCAALGSYWPAVAPDSARTFAPNKRAPGFDYPWPSIVPMTDQETGVEPLPDGRVLPWDGVRGPSVVEAEGRRYARYANIERIDYITLPGTMTAERTALVDLEETKARVMAMERVYWALGVHDPEIMERMGGDTPQSRIAIIAAKAQWAVLSFKAAEPSGELRAAERATGARLESNKRYRFHVYKFGPETPAPGDLFHVHVEMRDEHIVYVDGTQALVKRPDGAWSRDVSLPS